MTTPPAAPTVTPVYEGIAPYVEVIVTPGADNQTITLYRTDATGLHTVRGAVRALVSGPAVFLDFEVPFGETATYTAVGYDTIGTASPSSPPSAPITMDITGCPVVHDPTDVSTAMRWRVADWEELTYGRAAEVLRPMLSALAVGLIGTRQEPESTMVVLTKTDDEAAAMRELTRSPTVLIRPPASWGWPSRYWLLGEVSERRRSPKRGDAPARLFEFALTAVAAPGTTITSYLYTWATVVDAYDTWADVIAEKPSWLELLRHVPPTTSNDPGEELDEPHAAARLLDTP
ncbi:hypothetical protein [Phytomonospora endophytica]|uniref:Uncharacterized protein n=1 Tax=Phytomonospora endophytica TaxID=714109 RepID=A0A841FR76_9ACTN|nr:hypothetical protein [Phytomonospora endophytica]MBB6038324.1 hypothetical protein [Phytomonospora endophytica]GIG64255.1 hypothetical protein Pen01_05500 [Phytomonospora endophytica]